MPFLVQSGATVNFLASSFAGVLNMSPNSTPINSLLNTTTIADKGMCLQGDESLISLTVVYTAVGFPVPGTGRLSVIPFTPSNLSLNTEVSGKKAIINSGSPFQALLTVIAPATSPAAISDPVLVKPGQANFSGVQNVVEG